MKNHCKDNSKALKTPVFTSIQDSKLFNEARKVKKKKQYKNKRDTINPATRVNIAEVGDKKSKIKDISEIIYYNCNKKGHYITKCPNSQKSKTSFSLGDIYVNDKY